MFSNSLYSAFVAPSLEGVVDVGFYHVDEGEDDQEEWEDLEQ